jgi:hypothetical protein
MHMAPESIIEMRKRAIREGMDFEDAVGAGRPELQAFLNGSADKPKATKAVKKVVKKQPKAAATKAVKKAVPARKAAAPKKAAPRNGDSGRATIGKVDYSVESEAWKPRKGSAVEKIWKSLKKNRDNVDKVFTELRPNIGEYVHSKKNDGTTRTKAEKEATLKYRINRTRFEYAVRTGQHESSTNRVEYGTGPYAKGNGSTKAPAKKSTPVRKPANRKPANAQTRKPANKPAVSGARGRKKAAARR